MGSAPVWLDEFHPFTSVHILTVAGCAAVMATVVALGWLRRGTERERAVRRSWGWLVIVWQVFANVWWLLPSNFRLNVSLPLHICDLVAIVAGIAMLTDIRWLRTILYFWGIGLSTQAFITPVVQEGVGRVEFWLFFVGHTQIVGSAVYDVVVRKYRPGWRDLLAITAITFTYLGVILAFDLAFGVNYGYVGNTRPQRPTVIDRLGPWPLRVVKLSLVVAADFALLWLVWPLGRAILRRAPRRDQPSPPPQPPSAPLGGKGTRAANG